MITVERCRADLDLLGLPHAASWLASCFRRTSSPWINANKRAASSAKLGGTQPPGMGAQVAQDRRMRGAALECLHRRNTIPEPL